MLDDRTLRFVILSERLKRLSGHQITAGGMLPLGDIENEKHAKIVARQLPNIQQIVFMLRRIQNKLPASKYLATEVALFVSTSGFIVTDDEDTIDKLSHAPGAGHMAKVFENDTNKDLLSTADFLRTCVVSELVDNIRGSEHEHF